jgi:hypothetical protein
MSGCKRNRLRIRSIGKDRRVVSPSFDVFDLLAKARHSSSIKRNFVFYLFQIAAECWTAFEADQGRRTACVSVLLSLKIKGLF